MEQSDVQQSNQGGGGDRSSSGRKSTLSGPCYLKMIVNNLVAGSIIGKSGSVIVSIAQNSGATVKLSSPNKYFPGTLDRTVVISGTQVQLNNAIVIVLEKMGEVSGSMHSGGQGVDGGGMTNGDSQNLLTVKLAVPKSSVSAIMGKGGQQIKELQETTLSAIRISNREEGQAERIVHITGSFEAVQNAVLTIASSIQSDPNLKDHMYMNYDNNRLGGVGGMGGVAVGGVFGGAGSVFGGGIGAVNNGFGQGVGGFGGQAGAAGAMGGGANGDFNPRCEMVVFVPDDAVGTLIGKGGAVLNDIQNQSGARIQISSKGDLIPGTTERKCTISGSMACVHNAHFQLMQRLEQYQAKMALNQGGQHVGGVGGGGMGVGVGVGGGHQNGQLMGTGTGTPQIMGGGAMGGAIALQQHQLYNHPHAMQQVQQGGYMQGY